jgi:hypothetical protein
MLIPPWLISLTSFLAMLVMVFKKQHEHALTRFFVTAFYVFLWLYPETQVDTARVLNRWFWFLVFGIEVISWGVMRLVIRSKRNGHH